MKKLLSLTLALMLVFSLAACGGGGEEATTEEPIVLKVASTVQDESAQGAALYTHFEAYIEEKSEGRIDVQVYNNSQLGNDRQLVEAAQLGTIQASASPLSVMALFDPKFIAGDLPFLFKDKAAAYAALDGEFGDMMKSGLPDLGLIGGTYGENSFRNISNSKKPIHTPADMAGMKIRVMEAPAYLATMKAFGANPTPMAFSELYTGLSQGTVDGQDNGIILTYTAKLYEVQKYYTISEQQYAAAMILYNKTFFDGLDADLQQILMDGSKNFTEYCRVANAEAETELLEKMKAEGVEVNVLTDDEKQAFMELAKPVYDDLADDIGDQELVDLAKEISWVFNQ